MGQRKIGLLDASNSEESRDIRCEPSSGVVGSKNCKDTHNSGTTP